jgi:hypothetical protein
MGIFGIRFTPPLYNPSIRCSLANQSANFLDQEK